jgi:hypothetical protein
LIERMSRGEVDIDEIVKKSKDKSGAKLRKEFVQQARSQLSGSTKPKEKILTVEEEFTDTMETFGKSCLNKLISSFLMTCAMLGIAWYTGHLEAYMQQFVDTQ